jgi:dipeptidyl aminopeptidase/acylaminoacyl peptidase
VIAIRHQLPRNEKPDRARLAASPVFHVDDRDPPLLLIHGARHRGHEFFDDERLTLV